MAQVTYKTARLDPNIGPLTTDDALVYDTANGWWTKGEVARTTGGKIAADALPPDGYNGVYASVLGTPRRPEIGSAVLYDDSSSGQSVIGIGMTAAHPTTHDVYGIAQGTYNVLQHGTDGSGLATVYTFTDPVITAVRVLPTGTVLVATSDQNNVTTPATYIHMWRSTDGGSTFTQVGAGVFSGSGHVTGFNLTATAGATFAGTYGYKGNSDARFVYRSLDDGQTWALCLDIGANSDRHVHAIVIDDDGDVWVTEGDDGTGGTGNVGGRNTWRSTDQGATWVSYVFYDTDGVSRLQFVGLADFNGRIYVGEDNARRGGRIFRFDKTNPAGTLEVVWDPNPSGVLDLGTPWQTPVYSIAVEPVNNVLWAYTPGELANTHGRILASPDGANWLTMAEGGTGVVSPLGGAAFGFSTVATVLYLDNMRFNLKKVRRANGGRNTSIQTLTFTLPGSIGSKTELFAVHFGQLGYTGRIVRISAFTQTGPTGGTVTVTAKKSGVPVASTDAVIPSGATGSARYADATLNKNSLVQMFSSNDMLTIDVATTGTGAAYLTVAVVLEIAQAPMIGK